MTDLGTLGFNGGAMSINNRGQVVGYSGLVFGITHAFLWENGKITDLKTLDGHNDSIAYDINDLGQAIGYSADKNTQQSKPVIWSNGKLTELKLSVAMSITGLQLIIKDKQSVLATPVSMAVSVMV